MEPLPKGANFVRAKMLWEIGLNIAGDPDEPYTGNRDVCVSVGSASADHYRPYLRMSTGSPILAHAVMKGDLDMAFVNPSGFVTQMYRGTGLFEGNPLPGALGRTQGRAGRRGAPAAGGGCALQPRRHGRWIEPWPRGSREPRG